MSMLNFKHGLYGNLFNADGSNKVSIANGTIYVTTDEKAMYVDLDGKRIRLSQIVNIPDTQTWQNLTPPYSTEAFYYIVDANALLKYTGESWVQINSTAELDALIAGLGIYTVAPTSPKNGDILVQDGKVKIYDADAEGTTKWIDYGTIGSKLLDVSDRVGALATTVAGHGTDITDLKTRATNIETAAAETRKVVGFLGKKDATPATGNLGETVLVGEQVYIWLAKEGDTPAGWQPVTSLGGRVETLKARIEEVALAAGDQSAVEDLQEALGTLEGLVTNTETGLAATKAIADQVASDLADYQEAHASDYTNTQIDDAIALAKKAGTDAQKTIDDYITAHNALYATLSQKVTALETAGFVKADGTVSMTGALKLGGNKIVNVATPTDDLDATNKAYVDNAAKTAKDAADVADGKADAAAQAAETQKGRIDTILAEAGELNTFKKVAEELNKKQGTIPENTYDAYGAAAGVKDELLGKSTDNATAQTITGAHKAAAAAQETATGAANAAKAITDDATTLKTLGAVEQKFSSLNVSDLGGTENLVTEEEWTARKTAFMGTTTNESGATVDFDGTIKGAYDAADVAAGAAASAAQKGQKGIDDAAAALAEAQKKTTMADVEAKGYATGTELTNAVAAARGETTETVASVDAKVGGHDTRLTTLEGDVDKLEKDLLAKVQTADAMIYRGTVANEGELATKSAAIGGAHIGDTYKATEEFTMTNGPKVNIGDLLIASGTEAEGVITAETLTWDHVPSGYVANYNPELSTESTVANVVNVNLTSAHAADNDTGDLGSFSVSAATGSAVTVNVDSETNNIAIGMTWGTF